MFLMFVWFKNLLRRLGQSLGGGMLVLVVLLAGVSIEPLFGAETNAFTLARLDDEHRLGVGDKVVYRVIEDRDEPRVLVVSDSGELEIPYLGRIRADEKTCRELGMELKKVLEETLYYRATVILGIESLNQKRGKVYLMGQIKSPGAQEIPSGENFTVSKAILSAGGFGDFANQKRVKVIRNQGEGEDETYIVDVAEIFEKGRTEKDMTVQPGDLIFVPARLFNF